jgi:hypothetical protein
MELASNLKDKLFKVLMYLTQTKEEFEMVADEIEECNLKTALNGLSMESSLYANELCVQLQTLGISLNTPSCSELTGANGMPSHATLPGKGNELHYICSKSEDVIVNAYKNILSESVSLPGIYDLMMYQLNALKCAFTKIKMLNAARYNYRQNSNFSLLNN